MEEEELLFLLKCTQNITRTLLLTILGLMHLNALAQDNNYIASNLPKAAAKDMKWANDLANQFKDVARKEIIDKFLTLKNMQGRSEELELYSNKKERLRIFVSSSMPVSLLKAYNLEAVKYKGSLIFKGLPSSSFKELTKLVMEISKEGSKKAEASENNAFGHIEIDDGAFERFGISAVPSIVLSQNEGEGLLSSKDMKEEFDKISGSISIRLALEKFSESGDLQEVAARYLSK